MINIKNMSSIAKMGEAGKLLASIFLEMNSLMSPGVTTFDIDQWIEKKLIARGLVSTMKGYGTYRHVSCISVNEVVVHGVPSKKVVLRDGDLVKVDVCASFRGYCADMARSFFVGTGLDIHKKLVSVAQAALDRGIEKVVVGNRVSDISAAIQKEVELHGFGVVREFAGHGIGKNMHEDPEILNYGDPGHGPVLREGMAFAIEPMITQGDYQVYVDTDGWTVRTKDKGFAAHVEDTVVVTANGPKILTRENCVLV
jgi:methionyl aminopeptidase